MAEATHSKGNTASPLGPKGKHTSESDVCRCRRHSLLTSNQAVLATTSLCDLKNKKKNPSPFIPTTFDKSCQIPSRSPPSLPILPFVTDLSLLKREPKASWARLPAPQPNRASRRIPTDPGARHGSGHHRGLKCAPRHPVARR